MKIIGNILWLPFGGALLSLLWVIIGIICFCTIILVPLGFQCIKFARFILWPFGNDIMFSASTGSFLLNIIWIVVFGWELAVTSCVFGLLWCITIIGIPFGLQFFKFAKIALLPFGAQIVPCFSRN